MKLFHTPSSQMSYTSCPAAREKMFHVYPFLFGFSTHTHPHTHTHAHTHTHTNTHQQIKGHIFNSWAPLTHTSTTFYYIFFYVLLLFLKDRHPLCTMVVNVEFTPAP